MRRVSTQPTVRTSNLPSPYTLSFGMTAIVLGGVLEVLVAFIDGLNNDKYHFEVYSRNMILPLYIYIYIYIYILFDHETNCIILAIIEAPTVPNRDH